MDAPLKIDLKTLGQSYNTALIANLRNFGADGDFLETWVPDTDPIKNICNLIDAVAENKIARELEIRYSEGEGGNISLEILRSSLSSFVKVAISSQIPVVIIRITGIDYNRQNCIVRKNNPKTSSHGNNAVGNSSLQPENTGGPENEEGNLSVLSSGKYYDLDIDSKRQTSNMEIKPSLIGIEKEEDGVVVFLEINSDTHQVEKVETRCKPGTRWPKLLAHAERALTNLPIQEVSDHGVARLEAQLRSENWVPPVPGIFLPTNVFYEFKLLESLLRRIYSEYRVLQKFTGTGNDFDPGPTIAWKALKSEDKISKIEKVLKELVAAGTLRNNKIDVVKIEYDVRVTIRIDRLDLEQPLDKQKIVWTLEENLQNLIDPRLELYLEPVSDLSSLRRLD
jgi:hypothetical protein